MSPKILNVKQLSEVTGLSPVTIWRKEKKANSQIADN